MRLSLLIFFLITFSLPVQASESSRHFPAGARDVLIPAVKGVRSELLRRIAPKVEKSIAEGNYPGAVILAAHRGHIIYRGVFGNRRILPKIAPMRFDTVFDLASLTKVVATTPAIMQLVEQGKILLDAPVIKYWPEFGSQGKEKITVQELLTHTSGLPADLILAAPSDKPIGRNEILRRITEVKPEHPPGTVFVYSDINFIVLAQLVENVTGERIDSYTQRHIFKPLNMKNAFFLPSSRLHERIAPTEMINHQLRWGVVQDPTAYEMEGVAGHAGLFADASSLGIYAQCLLDAGRYHSHYLLGPLTVLKMITPQTPPDVLDSRGLGWDIDSDFSYARGSFFPVTSFGHVGWTGTSLWIDPATQTWVVILTNRLHPTAAKKNAVIQDRHLIASMIAASITDISIQHLNNTSRGELIRAYGREKVK